LLWVADQVDEALESYRERHGITEPWETRERVVVALTGAPGTEALIRRAARIAQRAHGELLGVHVQNEEGLAGPSTGLLERHRQLLVEMGGTYHEVAGAAAAGWRAGPWPWAVSPSSPCSWPSSGAVSVSPPCSCCFWPWWSPPPPSADGLRP